MGPTLSLVPPTSLVAPAQAPGPLAPFPGLPTRPVTTWVLGSPLGSSLLPSCLPCLGQQQSPPHLLPVLAPGPAPCFAPGPSSHHCSRGKRGRRVVGEANVGSGGSKRKESDSNLLFVWVFGPNPRTTDIRSLCWIHLEGRVESPRDGWPGPDCVPGAR